jgi:hypothetical protein
MASNPHRPGRIEVDTSFLETQLGDCDSPTVTAKKEGMRIMPSKHI